LAYFWDFSLKGASTVRTMSTRYTLQDSANSGEKYSETTYLTLSAIAPAVSTPVGPPPTITTLRPPSPTWCGTLSALSSAPSMREASLAASSTEYSG